MIVFACVLAWYISGVALFVYWWTKDNDCSIGDLLFALFVGVLGPIVGIIGFCIHGEKKTIFKRRPRS